MSNKENLRKEQALEYHANGRPGKIEVVPTKEAKTQKDLSLAYSPGVAIPCTEIKNNPSDVFKYTAKGNLVGVITNGTAVLGLGNIGPLASKPVKEGKAVLFKIFADIDVFDIEINETDPDKFIEEYISFLVTELPKGLKETDTNLLNIRDEMLSELQKLKYLLTLK